jgi:predicted acetyltransferase
VIRSHRRSGLGGRAAVQLWDRFPGRWIVRASEGNPGAVPFWAAIVSEYTGGAAVRSQRQGNPHLVQVFSFASPPAGRAGSGYPGAG